MWTSERGSCPWRTWTSPLSWPTWTRPLSLGTRYASFDGGPNRQQSMMDGVSERGTWTDFSAGGRGVSRCPLSCLYCRSSFVEARCFLCCVWQWLVLMRPLSRGCSWTAANMTLFSICRPMRRLSSLRARGICFRVRAEIAGLLRSYGCSRACEILSRWVDGVEVPCHIHWEALWRTSSITRATTVVLLYRVADGTVLVKHNLRP